MNVGTKIPIVVVVVVGAVNSEINFANSLSSCKAINYVNQNVKKEGKTTTHLIDICSCKLEVKLSICVLRS